MGGLDWTSIGTAAGGLGLLLLGMELLTAGLKRAAGGALHRLLGSWTRTRVRGLAAGTLITALVQSSSAVTVAIIGFANAGLLTLPEAAWVMFGSNLGTTMTSWLVSLVGLEVQVEAFALPALGAGMVVRMVSPASRLGGLGGTLAGFGALFVGLDLLRETFSSLAHAVDFAAVEEWGFLGQLAGVGLGALVTTLMQSSSAAMAVILTASSQGILSPPFAAALVIGANVGTTSTALLSTIGATPNARRVATLHVAFNLLTGALALALLVPILAVISRLHDLVAVGQTPAIDLALFHTTFNLLGIALMWPLSMGLVRSLERRFRSAEEDAARPQYLDNNVLPVPELAAHALLLELKRASSLGFGLARDAVDRTLVEVELFGARARPVRRLLIAIAEYSTRLSRTGLSPTVADSLTNMMRAHEHLWTIIHLSGDLVGLGAEVDEIAPHHRAPLSREYVSTALAVLRSADTTDPGFDLASCRAAKEEHEAARRREHQRLFELGFAGQEYLHATSQALQELARARRLVNRAWKLAATLHSVEMGLSQSGPPTPSKRSDGAPDGTADRSATEGRGARQPSAALPRPSDGQT